MERQPRPPAQKSRSASSSFAPDVEHSSEMMHGGKVDPTCGRSRLVAFVAFVAMSFVACSLIDDLDQLSSGLPGADAGGAAGSGNGGSGGASGGGVLQALDAGAGGSSGGAAGAGATGSTDAGGGAAEGGTGAGGSSTDGGAPGATRMFWLERGAKTVRVANTDGTQNEPVLTLTGGASSGLLGIAADSVGARLYFTDETRQRIQHCNLDGTGVQSFLTGLAGPTGIDLDVAAGKLYFTERGAPPRIQRANLDGSALEPLITSVDGPRGLAVHANRGKLYFLDDGLDAVFSADLDGSNLTDLSIDGVDDPVEISIDTLEEKLYWSELGAGGPRIRRAHLDGSGVEDIITPLTVPGFSVAAGLEVDVPGRMLYFVDGGGTGSILRSHLDGTEVVPVLGNSSDPTGLTLVGP